MEVADRKKIKSIMMNVFAQVMELNSISEKYLNASNECAWDSMKSEQLRYFAERVDTMKSNILSVMKTSAHEVDIDIAFVEEL